ncbi:zinc-dependent metalloprotease family protein [Haloferula sp.]|uniref:zinc-dependent metalloprotease family protein n=1 Tax=Haloferula sp. TaxID=2497595 RepID=UPI00329CFC03
MLKEHRPSRVRLLFLPILTSLALCDAAPAAVSVEPPQPITHRVVIQPIRVRDTTDGPIADFMGTASSETYIKEQINLIWAQVGVEIKWLDTVEHIDRFAYDGWPGNYTNSSRPNSHLGDMIDDAGFPPKSDSPIELNFFFVNIAAGFPALGANTVAGLANIDRNGSSIYVGSSLLTWPEGRDVVASVVAHEIGHNLGLLHYQADTSNLMYSGSGDGEELISSQETTIFSNRSGYDSYEFLQTAPAESNYLVWSEAFNLQEGTDGDDDKDGLSNAFEFLNGSSPLEFTAFPTFESTPSGLTWTLNKESDAIEDGFDFLAESSTDLSEWKLVGTAGSSSSILEDSTSRLQVLLSNSFEQNFIRFDVALPPEAAIASSASPLLFPEPEPEAEVHSNCGIGGCGHRTLYRH